MTSDYARLARLSLGLPEPGPEIKAVGSAMAHRVDIQVSAFGEAVAVRTDQVALAAGLREQGPSTTRKSTRRKS
jgi:hypothetical protein